MGRLKQIIKYEKSQTNGVRWRYNAFLFVLLLVFIVFGIIALVLLKIDEDKYSVPSICLIAIGSGCFCLIIPLTFFPPIRNKEVAIEAARYDFDESKVEEKDSYLFESTIVNEEYETEVSPFAETSEPITGIGSDALNEALRPILGERFVQIPIDPPALTQKFSVSDYSYKEQYRPFEITQAVQSNGKLRVTVTEKSSLCFHKDGITLNKVTFPYSEVKATLRTSNYLMRVSLELEIRLRSDLSVFFRLDNKALRIIKQFDITVTNRAELDYIVNNKEKAFRHILKTAHKQKQNIKENKFL